MSLSLKTERPQTKTPAEGQVVLSLAGRDAGRPMVVIEADAAEGFALVADGRRRRLATPKRKRAKHLLAVGIVLMPEKYATDRRLRKTLSTLQGIIQRQEENRREAAEDNSRRV